ncbi:MAG TPA: hypothetical protein PLZ50_09350, partial [Rubrivivax sp.]|nr:hypothetical protein [Rubrivivax sp.]
MGRHGVAPRRRTGFVARSVAGVAPRAAAARPTATAQRHASAENDRLGALARCRFEAGDHAPGNGVPHELLDVVQEALLVQAHERDRLAAGAGAAGAADAVHIVLGHVGQFEVDDVRQLVDVDAARGDVG